MFAAIFCLHCQTHSPGVGGIGFVISPQCSCELISWEFFQLELENFSLISAAVEFIYYLYMPRPQSIHIQMKQCLLTTDSLQLTMQSHHAITFSYVVTSTQHRLSIKFVSKTDAVKLIVTLRCSNPLLSAMTCLLQIHTQGKTTAHFRPLMDQMGVRHG